MKERKEDTTSRRKGEKEKKQTWQKKTHPTKYKKEKKHKKTKRRQVEDQAFKQNEGKSYLCECTD